MTLTLTTFSVYMAICILCTLIGAVMIIRIARKEISGRRITDTDGAILVCSIIVVSASLILGIVMFVENQRLSHLPGKWQQLYYKLQDGDLLNQYSKIEIIDDFVTRFEKSQLPPLDKDGRSAIMWAANIGINENEMVYIEQKLTEFLKRDKIEISYED